MPRRLASLIVAASSAALARAADTCTDVHDLYTHSGCCDATPPVSLDVALRPHHRYAVLMTGYETGPYADLGSVFAHGMRAGFDAYLPNVELDTCETGYDSDNAEECFDRRAGTGILAVMPLSTGAATRFDATHANETGIPQMLSGYGQGLQGPATRSVGPSYADGLRHWVDAHPTGTLGFLYFNDVDYGKLEAPVWESLVPESRRIGTGCSLYAFFGANKLQAGPTCWDTVKVADYIYIQLWGTFVHTQILQHAMEAGVIDTITTVWWGGAIAEMQNYTGMHALTFAPPAHSPVAEEAGTNFASAQAARDAIVLSAALRKSASPSGYLTPGRLSEALATLDLSDPAHVALLGDADGTTHDFSGFLLPCVPSSDCASVQTVTWTGHAWE